MPSERGAPSGNPARSANECNAGPGPALDSRSMRRRRPIAVVAVLVALVVVLAACKQILALDGEPTVASHAACGVAVAPGPCQSCVAAKCCEAASACAGDPGCSAFESCVLGCGSDYRCRAECEVRAPSGPGLDVAAFNRCLATECETECGESCGLPTGYAEPDAAVACQDCIVAHACDTTAACAGDLDCLLVGRCKSQCRTLDCSNACAASSEAGATLWANVIHGVGSACLAPCGIGAYWQCVGKVAFPFPKSEIIRAQIAVSDVSGGSPLQGSVVKACRATDAMCTEPVAMGTTGADGIATLALSRAFTGYGFAAYFEVAAPGYVPFLYFLSFPLSEPNASLTINMTSQTTFAQLTSLVRGFTPDPTRGVIVSDANDCHLTPASDVVFTADGIDDKTLVRYIIGHFPSATATATDISGLVFFLDVPALVPLTVHATPKALGRAASNVNLFTRAGAISYVQALPTP